MGDYRPVIQRQPRAASAIEVAGFGTSGDFARAARHSKRVRWLRWAIPIVIAAGIGGYYLATDGTSGVAVDFGNVAFDEGGTVIAEPRVTAYQTGGQAYQLDAERAVQQTGNPDLLRLEGVDARYAMLNGETAEFTAPFGIYDAATSILILSGGVTMVLGSGVEGVMEELTVDVEAGTIASDHTFELTAGNLELTGGILELTPEGLFANGGVQTILATDGTLAPMPRIGGDETR
jgi:lipopolysaccharide export system protein LptC